MTCLLFGAAILRAWKEWRDYLWCDVGENMETMQKMQLGMNESATSLSWSILESILRFIKHRIELTTNSS